MQQKARWNGSGIGSPRGPIRIVIVAHRQCVTPEWTFTQLGNTVTKDELRAELERQEQRYKEVYGGEITRYAAQPEPERKPWRKRATIRDQAFTQELQKMEKELKAEQP